MRIVFIGPPGLAKARKSQRLVEYLNIPHLSTGDMLRQACQRAVRPGPASREQYMAAGKAGARPDHPASWSASGSSRTIASDGYLLDGFPRTLGQAQALDEFLARRGTPLTAVLELKVDPEELVRRLAGRGRDGRSAGGRPRAARSSTAGRRRRLSDYYRRQGLAAHDRRAAARRTKCFGRIQAVGRQIDQSNARAYRR